MARKQRKGKSSAKRAERRRRALAEAAAASAVTSEAPSADITDPSVLDEKPDVTQPRLSEPPKAAIEDDEHRDRRWAWVLVPIGGLLIVAILLAGQWLDQPSGVIVPSASKCTWNDEVGSSDRSSTFTSRQFGTVRTTWSWAARIRASPGSKPLAGT